MPPIYLRCALMLHVADADYRKATWPPLSMSSYSMWWLHGNACALSFTKTKV